VPPPRLSVLQPRFILAAFVGDLNGDPRVDQSRIPTVARHVGLTHDLRGFRELSSRVSPGDRSYGRDANVSGDGGGRHTGDAGVGEDRTGFCKAKTDHFGQFVTLYHSRSIDKYAPSLK
jgi:hypothetical protein